MMLRQTTFILMPYTFVLREIVKTLGNNAVLSRWITKYCLKACLVSLKQYPEICFHIHMNKLQFVLSKTDWYSSRSLVLRTGNLEMIFTIYKCWAEQSRSSYYVASNFNVCTPKQSSDLINRIEIDPSNNSEQIRIITLLLFP